jgi:hypothetical protein
MMAGEMSCAIAVADMAAMAKRLISVRFMCSPCFSGWS